MRGSLPRGVLSELLSESLIPWFPFEKLSSLTWTASTWIFHYVEQMSPVIRPTRMMGVSFLPMVLWDPCYALQRCLLGVTNNRNVIVIFEILELGPSMFQFSSKKVFIWYEFYMLGRFSNWCWLDGALNQWK